MRSVEIYKWDTTRIEGGARGAFVLEGVGRFVQYGTDMVEFHEGGCTFSTAIIEMPDGEVRSVPLSGSHKIKFQELLVALLEEGEKTDGNHMSKATKGIDLIDAEQKRHRNEEGWSEEHDEVNNHGGQLGLAAACYAASASGFDEIYASTSRLDPGLWPWDEEWDKRQKHDRLKKLIIAGALIASDIDRILREQG